MTTEHQQAIIHLTAAAESIARVRYLIHASHATGDVVDSAWLDILAAQNAIQSIAKGLTAVFGETPGNGV